MPSTPTSSNRFEKQGTGENANTWGTRLNDNTIELIDDAIDGMAAYALSGAKTLVSTNYAADEARMAIQHVTSGTGGTVTIPGVHKWYLVNNTSSGTVTFTTGAGTTGVVAAGDQRIVVCDGTNVYNLRALDYGAELPVSTGTPTLSTQMATKGYVDGISFSSSLPGQAGQAGKFITTDGTTASWATITKSTVGLANVDNTTDLLKPVSTATQTALNLKANNTITISAGTGLVGGGNLTANRTISPDLATQAEAEAGASSTKLMTPQRVAQYVAVNGGNYTLLSTTTISGSSTSSVSQTGLSGYSDVLIVLTSISHDDTVTNRSLQAEFSADGATFSPGIDVTSSFINSSTVTGSAFVTSHLGKGVFLATTASEIFRSGSFSLAAALSVIRLSWSAAATDFDSGTISFYAR